MPTSNYDGRVGMEKESETYWVTIPPECGWILATVDGRKMGLVVFFDKNGYAQLRAAGFHAGETKWVGDKHNILAIRVERIPEEDRSKLVPEIRSALASDLKDAEILFSDDKYFIGR